MNQTVTTIPAIRITRLRLTLILTALAVVAAAILGGCAKFTEPFKDAPRSGVINSQPADQIEMPDGVNNLFTKCDHGNRIYISYHGDGAYGFGFAVPNAPDC